MTNVVSFNHRRPRSFTKAEEVLDEIRERIHMDGRTKTQIAVASGVSSTTIGNIASAKTRWPRHTTLFPLLAALRMHLRIDPPEDK